MGYDSFVAGYPVRLEALKYIDRFAAIFHQTTVGASDYSEKADLIDTLMRAIEERRVTFITYQSLQATEPVTYDIHPFGLTYHRGSLYLVGHAPEHDSIRHWKVDRNRSRILRNWYCAIGGHGL